MEDAVRLVTITVSDTRRKDDDRSGTLLGELLRAAGHVVVAHRLVKDEKDAIAELIMQTAERGEAQAIVLTGGTGIAPRDVTPEALESIAQTKLDGFGELFRRLSYDEIGPRAVFSRALAVVVKGVVIFALPGSTNAVRLGIERVILPMLVHAVHQASGTHLSHAH